MFGLAGGLQPEGRIGDIVLCARAIRDAIELCRFGAADEAD